jgi:hypothetical protein
MGEVSTAVAKQSRSFSQQNVGQAALHPRSDVG